MPAHVTRPACAHRPSRNGRRCCLLVLCTLRALQVPAAAALYGHRTGNREGIPVRPSFWGGRLLARIFSSYAFPFPAFGACLGCSPWAEGGANFD